MLAYDSADPDQLRRELLFRPCDSQQELHDWIVAYLGIDYPDVTVDEESNSSPMGMIWEVYSKARANDDPGFRRVMYYASRSSYKTLAAATLEVLVMLHLGRDVCHMAAIRPQSQKAQQYVKEAFRRPYLRDFVVGDNKTSTEVVRYYNPNTGHSLTRSEFTDLHNPDAEGYEEYRYALNQYQEWGVSVQVIVCTMQGTNAFHSPFFVADEVDVVANPAAYEEAKRIPSGRNGMLPITVLISSRKTGTGLVQREINEAKRTGLHVRHWNVIDVTAPCPPSRHLPNLGRLPLYYSNDEFRHVDAQAYAEMPPNQRDKFVEYPDAYAGCRSCSLFVGCKTRLATHQTSTSRLLIPIDETIGRIRDGSIEMVLAQDMCRKPSSVGLVFPRFDVSVHVLSPSQAYMQVFGEEPREGKWLTRAEFERYLHTERPETERVGGMDYGETHLYTYVGGHKVGTRLFLTRFFAAAELDPEQQIEAAQPIKAFTIYPEQADHGANRLFSKAGFTMVPWKKMDPKWKVGGGAGSVFGGISIVRAKLRPPGGRPSELFLIQDVDGDPYCDEFVQAFREWSWKKGPDGQPTGIPEEKWKDYVDAVRYCVMNVFPLRGQLAASNHHTPPPPAQIGPPSAQGWAVQEIARRTGNFDHAPEPERPSMRVELPNGRSYYDDPEGDRRVEEKKSGKRGRLVWSF